MPVLAGKWYRAGPSFADANVKLDNHVISFKALGFRASRDGGEQPQRSVSGLQTTRYFSQKAS
jgi:hypothetical protein